jgi:outer membrane protein TolC
MDVDEAQQNVLRAQDSLVRAQQDYERALDNFKIRLALPTDANIVLDQDELKALADIGVGDPGFTLDAAVETALLRRLDLANTQDKIDDALRKVALAADGLGTQLDVTADIGYSSPSDNTQFEKLQFNQGNYNLGFEADLPLDRKSQRNTYRRALIDLQRQQRQYESDIDTIKLQVRDAYRLLIETADRYRIQKNSLDLARQRVESNELLLNAGRVTVRILLESQDALVQAENAVTAALVDHLDAKLSFYRDVGILQVKPDGMWAQQNTISNKPTNGNANESQEPENNS